MSKRLISAALGLLVLATGTVGAHGGGLNAEGCHNNRKTGDYRCHRAPAAVAPEAALTPASRAQAKPAAKTGAPPFYRNCAEARAAGAAPVKRGEPGYGSHLDRDNDGVGCQ